MKIIRCIAGLVCLGSLFMFPSCNKSTVPVPLGNWVHTADYQGVPSSGAFCFTIGDISYVGLGYYGGLANGVLLQYPISCWAFNPAGSGWTVIAPFPGIPRERAVSFSINGKGYVGTGYNRAQDSVAYIQLKDFWEYDPAANQWRQLSDFGGGARYNAVGFADTQYGYVGTGYDGIYHGDFWRYNPADDSWKQIATYPGTKRQQATIVPIDGKFYLMSGYNNNSYVLDTWKFDPTAPENDAWTNVTPLATDAQYANFKIAVSRYDAVGFGLNGMGYIATGISGSTSNAVYQYNPADLGTWTKMTPYERAPRSQAVAFVLGGIPYLGTGLNGSTRFDDMEYFNPLADYDAND
jgi:N-acetylneuraminic acid mutarotase